MGLSRRHRGLPAVLALLLIGVWVCIGLVHEHTGAPTCQICNALQFSASDLVTVAPLAAPLEVVAMGFVAPAPAAATASHSSTPQGRAPPSA